MGRRQNLRKGRIGALYFRGADHSSLAPSFIRDSRGCVPRILPQGARGQGRKAVKAQNQKGQPPAKKKQDRAAMISFGSQHKAVPRPTSIAGVSPCDEHTYTHTPDTCVRTHTGRHTRACTAVSSCSAAPPPTSQLATDTHTCSQPQNITHTAPVPL